MLSVEMGSPERFGTPPPATSIELYSALPRLGVLEAAGIVGDSWRHRRVLSSRGWPRVPLAVGGVDLSSADWFRRDGPLSGAGAGSSFKRR